MSENRVREILETAKRIISDEKRWTTGCLVDEGLAREFLDSGVKDPLCGSVPVCALGAIGIAAFDGEFVKAIIDDGDEEVSYEMLKADPDSARAKFFVDQAASEAIGVPFDPDPDRENTVVDLNDSCYTVRQNLGERTREEAYRSILDCFDRALELEAESRVAA